MLQLVSLAQASVYLRRTTADDDADVALLIQAASQSVAHHLASGQSFLDFLDSDLQAQTADSDGVAQEVPPVVQAATLYLTAWLYRHRDEDDQKAFENGFLPSPVRALLGPLRDPVMS